MSRRYYADVAVTLAQEAVVGGIAFFFVTVFAAAFARRRQWASRSEPVAARTSCGSRRWASWQGPIRLLPEAAVRDAARA